MSLYNIQISGRQYQVEIMGEQVKLNGRQINVGLMPSNLPGLFSFIQGKQKRDLFLHHQMNGTYAITTEGRQMVAEVEMENSTNTEKAADLSADEDKLRAPMPGVVLHVHAAEGERVNEGQLLVTLESMKMQMEFRAPFEGEVAQVAVQPGQKVEKAALMVVLKRA
ncbi:MAG: biotin/lipoyl-containing protein [Anaerolineaceae bacterium]|jgi:biotin carboxyl carrier protein|nr:biotin/lipoyl-containing protein [Anaerolineaceae bacterium]